MASPESWSRTTDGPQEHHQVGLSAAAHLALEQVAEHRHVAQAAESSPVEFEYSSDSRPPSTMMLPSSTSTFDSIERLVVVGPLTLFTVEATDARDLLEDLHLDRAGLADLRAHAQRQADVLALDGLERVDGVGVAAGVGVLAGDEGHVLADDDLGFLVVQRQQVRRGQHVALAVAGQEAGQEAQHVLAVVAVAVADAEVEAAGGPRRRVAGRQADRQVDDVGAAQARVGADHADVAVAAAADAGLPLDAELGRLVGVDLDDQAFDQHLRAAAVEPVDHRAQLPVERLGRADDQRVGGRIGLDLPAGRRRRRWC